MRRTTRGNILTWYNPSATNTDLNEGGFTDPSRQFSALFALSGEQFSFCINTYIPNAAALVVSLWQDDTLVSANVGTLTRFNISGTDYVNYGSITIPTGLRSDLYYLKVTVATGVTWHSTPIFICDQTFANDHTLLIEYRNRYTIDSIPYPHLPDTTFTQKLRLRAYRSSVEPVEERQEFRRSDGTIYTVNVLKAVRHRIAVLNCDRDFIDGLITLCNHDAIKIRGVDYKVVSGLEVGEATVGRTSTCTFVLEEIRSAWAQSHANL
jgi:hypothetical protein